MGVAMTSELHCESELDIFQVLVTVVAGGKDAHANTLPRIKQRDVFRGIHQLQRVRPLPLNDGFSQNFDLRFNLRRRWLMWRISCVLGVKGQSCPSDRYERPDDNSASGVSHRDTLKSSHDGRSRTRFLDERKSMVQVDRAPFPSESARAAAYQNETPQHNYSRRRSTLQARLRLTRAKGGVRLPSAEEDKNVICGSRFSGPLDCTSPIHFWEISRPQARPPVTTHGGTAC